MTKSAFDEIAINIEEYVPDTIPINIAILKFKISLLPKNINTNTGNKVVKEVLIVLVKFSLTLLLHISTKLSFVNLSFLLLKLQIWQQILNKLWYSSYISSSFFS